eukprot:TRINITY_DN10218_c0_g3_i1.p1 TRINITY_DN10218_c0_g3~~TRINITY_DN10218_c0_g3_i1.p1  ORF type:complete len:120 (+),score=19.31 TRINITY_DN10218_c0_g3_i1:75-434(+)
MASRASVELAWASRVQAGTLPMLPEANLLEAEHSTSSGSSSEAESTSSGRLTRELLGASPSADVRAIVDGFWANPQRSRNKMMATSRTPTADAVALGTPVHPVAPTCSHPQSPAIEGAP